MWIQTKSYDYGIRAILEAFPSLKRELDLPEDEILPMWSVLGRLAEKILFAKPLGELPRLDVQEGTATYWTKEGVQISFSPIKMGWEIHVFWPENKPFDEKARKLYEQLSELGFKADPEDPYEFDSSDSKEKLPTGGVPFAGFSDATLENLPSVKEGDKIKCAQCGKKHTLKGPRSVDNRAQIYFYRCGGKSYFGAVCGKLVAFQKADFSGTISKDWKATLREGGGQDQVHL